MKNEFCFSGFANVLADCQKNPNGYSTLDIAGHLLGFIRETLGNSSLRKLVARTKPISMALAQEARKISTDELEPLFTDYLESFRESEVLVEISQLIRDDNKLTEKEKNALLVDAQKDKISLFLSKSFLDAIIFRDNLQIVRTTNEITDEIWGYLPRIKEGRLYEIAREQLNKYPLDMDYNPKDTVRDYEEVIRNNISHRILNLERFKFNVIESSEAKTEGWKKLGYSEEEFAERCRKKSDDSKKLGYSGESVEKLHLSAFHMGNRDPKVADSHNFIFEGNSIGYFEQIIYRDYLNGQDSTVVDTLNYKENVQKYVKSVRKKSTGFYEGFTENEKLTSDDNHIEEVDMFPFMSGCGVWIVSFDNYLILSMRSAGVYELPNKLGYSAAGSCDFNDNEILEARRRGLSIPVSNNGKEANPFFTASRELFEETGIQILPENLNLISFGLDFERYLQQFSFYAKSEHTASEILDIVKGATTNYEGKLFPIPFTKGSISTLIDNFYIEPGALVSLQNISKKHFG